MITKTNYIKEGERGEEEIRSKGGRAHLSHDLFLLERIGH
jgi:hypothetical protein